MLNFIDFLNEARSDLRRSFSDTEMGVASDLMAPEKEAFLKRGRNELDAETPSYGYHRPMTQKDKEMGQHSYSFITPDPHKHLADLLDKQSPTVRVILKNPTASAQQIYNILKKDKIEILPHPELWLKHAGIQKLYELKNKIKQGGSLNLREKQIYIAWTKALASIESKSVNKFSNVFIGASKDSHMIDKLNPENVYPEIIKFDPVISKQEAELGLISKLQNDVKNKQHIVVKNLDNTTKTIRQAVDKFTGRKKWGTTREPGVLDTLYNKTGDYSRDWSPSSEISPEEFNSWSKKKQLQYQQFNRGFIGQKFPAGHPLLTTNAQKNGLDPIDIKNIKNKDLPDFGASPEEGFPDLYIAPQWEKPTGKIDRKTINKYNKNSDLEKEQIYKPARTAITSHLKKWFKKYNINIDINYLSDLSGLGETNRLYKKTNELLKKDFGFGFNEMVEMVAEKMRNRTSVDNWEWDGVRGKYADGFAKQILNKLYMKKLS